jgi:septum formation protein
LTPVSRDREQLNAPHQASPMNDRTPPQAIYLASKSPRRAELLRQLGVEFTELRLREAPGRERDVVEGPRPGESPRDYVTRIARTKALIAWHRMGQRSLPPLPVLAADTEVVLDGAIFGKPADPADAARMLAALSGRTHEVMTALFLKWEQAVHGTVSVSRVTFRLLDPAEIERYCASGEPLDKAGAYAIQGRGAAFVERLEGSYSGVMGLPLFETAGTLAQIGVSVL